MSSVARPACSRTSATYRLRGLKRLLPLPCANATIPRDAGGILRSPSIVTPSTGIWTERSVIGIHHLLTVDFAPASIRTRLALRRSWLRGACLPGRGAKTHDQPLRGPREVSNEHRPN